MKASRARRARAGCESFRLNDKCAAGTGAFLEKTARYLGYAHRGDRAAGGDVARRRSPISGVCAVFAESEVINHLSQGAAPADIMQGAIVSLVDALGAAHEARADGAGVHAGRRHPALRVAWAASCASSSAPQSTCRRATMVQFVAALGAAVLGQRRLKARPSSGCRCPAARTSGAPVGPHAGDHRPDGAGAWATGGASGIGLAIARHLPRTPARASSRSIRVLRQSTNPASTGGCSTCATPMRSSAMAGSLEAEHLGADILVNAAGITPRRRALETAR